MYQINRKLRDTLNYKANMMLRETCLLRTTTNLHFKDNLVQLKTISAVTTLLQYENIGA